MDMPSYGSTYCLEYQHSSHVYGKFMVRHSSMNERFIEVNRF